MLPGAVGLLFLGLYGLPLTSASFQAHFKAANKSFAASYGNPYFRGIEAELILFPQLLQKAAPLRSCAPH